MDNLEWKPSEAPDYGDVGRLSQDTGLSPLVASLLIQRDADQNEVDDFWIPTGTSLRSFSHEGHGQRPWRIMQAIDRNERIMVYGDYDVDGTTSVAMVSSFLQRPPSPSVALHSHALRRRVWGVSQRSGTR